MRNKNANPTAKHLSIHDELKHEKKQANSVLEKAKQLEAQKLASGGKYIRVNAHTVKLIS